MSANVVSAFMVVVTDDEQGYADVAAFGPFRSREIAEAFVPKVERVIDRFLREDIEDPDDRTSRLMQISVGVDNLYAERTREGIFSALHRVRIL